MPLSPAKKDFKVPLQFKITLTEEQKLVKAGIYEKDVTIILGGYGAGKTQVAAMTALDLLFKGHIDKIFITRPIDFKATGFLTGNVAEKLAFHIFPIKQNMYTCYNKEKIDKEFTAGNIEIVPIDYMKGYTIARACLIVDEFEDINFKDFELLLTRLGKDSKIIFTGSEEQIGIGDSCIRKVKSLVTCPSVNYHVLKAQHRNPDIELILDHIKTNTI